MLWDLNEGKHLYTLNGAEEINALCFSPNRYWLCAAAGPTIKIWVRNMHSLRTMTREESKFINNCLWGFSLESKTCPLRRSHDCFYCAVFGAVMGIE